MYICYLVLSDLFSPPSQQLSLFPGVVLRTKDGTKDVGKKRPDICSRWWELIPGLRTKFFVTDENLSSTLKVQQYFQIAVDRDRDRYRDQMYNTM